MKKVWHGVNLMSGYESKYSKSLANKVKKATVEYVNDLNKFYNRFDRHEFSKCVDHVKRNAFGNNSHFVCTNEQTPKEFNRLVVLVVVVVVVVNFIKHQNRAITGEFVAARAAPSYQYAMVLVIIT